jgi:RNA polymerase sigma-70 factor (ECF subfamily)
MLETAAVQSTDRELIVRAQQGDAAAFEALVHRYDRNVLAIAASYANDPDDAKDIYQDVFLRVYRSLNQFQFRSEFSTWLYRITTNVCLTYRTRKQARSFASLEEVDILDEPDGDWRSKTISPERQAQSAEISRHIERAMQHLSPQQRMVFTLKHFEGYKLAEIASMMECAEGTVKRYLFTATEKLRQRLERLY